MVHRLTSRRLYPLVLGILALFLCSSAAMAQPAPAKRAAPEAAKKDLVAVMDLQPLGAGKLQATALTERLREELLKTGRFTLVDRSQMDKLLEEQALQQTGCTSTECAVQVGKMLGVRKLVMGKLTRIEDTLWQLSVLMVDVETAETMRAETINHEGTYRALLTGAIAPLAERLAGAKGQAAAQTGALKVAVFPIKAYSGAGDSHVAAALRGIVSAFKTKNINATVTHAVYPDQFDNVQPLDKKAVSDAWSGIITPTPDMKFLAGKGKELGVNAILLVRVPVPAEES